MIKQVFTTYLPKSKQNPIRLILMGAFEVFLQSFTSNSLT
ncbi:hypothetical protein AO372_0340 [Moraxella catarrhalis]|nr:hypothetical protein AO372_0340 [Moraxella catarrhalis]